MPYFFIPLRAYYNPIKINTLQPLGKCSIFPNIFVQVTYSKINSFLGMKERSEFLFHINSKSFMYICNVKANIRYNLSFLDRGISETFNVEDGKIFYTNYTKQIKKDNFNIYDDEITIEQLIGEDELINYLEKIPPVSVYDTYL